MKEPDPERHYRMTDQRSVPLAVVITVVTSVAIAAVGVSSGAVAQNSLKQARESQEYVERLLAQDERLRAIENRDARRDEQLANIAADITEIKNMFGDHVKGRP